MGKPKAPEPPDPKETSAAQTGTNVGTAIANTMMGNVNQETPFGSLTYGQTGSYDWTDPYTGSTYEIPTFTATQTLSPEQQALKAKNDQTASNLADLGVSQSGRLTNLLSEPFDVSGLTERTDYTTFDTPSYRGVSDVGDVNRSVSDAGDITRTYSGDFSTDRKRVEESLFERARPEMERDLAALETRLRNQGLAPGSEAWREAMDDHNRGVNDFRLATIHGAGQEHSRLVGMDANRAAFENAAQAQQYGQNLSRAGFENQAQAQAFGQAYDAAALANANARQAHEDALRLGGLADQTRSAELQEAFATRNQPLNEIAALMSGSQVTMPSFANTGTAQIPTTDNAGLINQNYNQRHSNWKQQIEAQNGLFGSLLGLGGTLGAAGIKGWLG